MPPPSVPGFDEKYRGLVEACFRIEVGPSAALPDDEVDLIETGILDSMAWVSFLRVIETASGISDLGSGLNERSPSLGEVLVAMRNSVPELSSTDGASLSRKISSSLARTVLTGSSAVPGSRLIRSAQSAQVKKRSSGSSSHRPCWKVQEPNFASPPKLRQDWANAR